MRNEANRAATGPPTDPLDELLRSAQWPDESADRLDDLLHWPNGPQPMSNFPRNSEGSGCGSRLQRPLSCW